MEQYEQIPVGNAKDLTGKQFGRWTVLYRVKAPSNNKSKSAYWLCRCECGTVKAVIAQNLNNGSSVSCGCWNREKASERMTEYNVNQNPIQIGQRFGKLVVIKDLGYRKEKSRDKNERWVLCQCDCGNTKEVDTNSLHVGRVHSCGCLHSYGEYVIQKLLEENNICFKREYSFDDLLSPKGKKLRFDFAIFENDELQLLIEFDGRQHFSGPEAQWSHAVSLEEIQEKDELKNQYCQKNNIKLIRLTMSDLNKLTIKNLWSK